MWRFWACLFFSAGLVAGWLIALAVQRWPTPQEAISTGKRMAICCACGALFLLCYLRFGGGADAVAACIFCSMLILCAWVDVRHMIVLDGALLVYAAAALSVSVFFGALTSWHGALLGAVAGALPLLLLALLIKRMTGQWAMGGGDIKFMAVVGLFLGWQNALLTLFFGSLGGGLVVVVLLLAKKLTRKSRVPFVPMLAGGALCALLAGEPLVKWYLSFFVT